LRLVSKSFFVISMMLFSGLAISTAQPAAAAQMAGIKPAGTKPAGTKTSGKKSVSVKTHTSARHRKSARKTSWKRKGQQGIQPERTREIQTALIREKYLSGEPTGIWDSRTQEAITRYQADHGWQTKVTPDSRALIKLGLGPNYSSSEMINPVAKPAAVTANAGGQAAANESRDKQ
jgi:peptidoglycan hydrolase-like protein with peptidoglycan-binding domain